MGSVYKNLMERYFALKISFLIFRRPKKFSSESFLTFRELQPLVSYKRVSYKKNTFICKRFFAIRKRSFTGFLYFLLLL